MSYCMSYCMPPSRISLKNLASFILATLGEETSVCKRLTRRPRVRFLSSSWHELILWVMSRGSLILRHDVFKMSLLVCHAIRSSLSCSQSSHILPSSCYCKGCGLECLSRVSCNHLWNPRLWWRMIESFALFALDFIVFLPSNTDRRVNTECNMRLGSDRQPRVRDAKMIPCLSSIQTVSL